MATLPPTPVPADDLEALLKALPPHISDPIQALPERLELLEVILDLGREPEARFPGREVLLSSHPITEEDIEHVIQRIGAFGEDNRAGIARTLHRISAIRNRNGRIIGLTCRVGRAVFGTLTLLQDIIESEHSVLMMGRPGVGKTTMLREAARVLADELRKRVIIVDTSNEIGGAGDIPHPAIGRARRMQVPAPHLQHAVMIEAVENHMPEVIVIDEIGTEREAQAARTIAERGVQLIGTAHGNTLFNLLLNPTLSDLVGGIQPVTLSDEEARRRGTQKTVLERKAPPTFDQLVEIQSHSRLQVHQNVAETVDALLRGKPAYSTLRYRDEKGEIHIERSRLSPPTLGPLREALPTTLREPEREPRPAPMPTPGPLLRPLRLYPSGVNKALLAHTLHYLRLPARLVDSLEEADVLLTVRSSYRRRPRPVRRAQEMDLPIHVLESNARDHIEEGLLQIFSQPEEHPAEFL